MGQSMSKKSNVGAAGVVTGLGSVHGHGPSVDVETDFSTTWRSK